MNKIAHAGAPLLEIDVIRSFVAIAETGSFTNAGQLVGRTPSAISMQIKKLETMLGRPVFNREGRSVSLTEDGEELLGYGRRMLLLNNEALGRFRTPDVEGVVRIGAPDDFGTRFLPAILSSFALICPSVQVDVRLEPSVDLMRRMDAGRLDLALVTGQDDKVADSEIVYTERLVWAGIKSGCAYCSQPLALALSSPSCPWRRAAIAALEGCGRGYRIAYTSSHCAGQMAAMLADLAVAPWPLSLIEPPLVDVGQAGALPEIGHYELALRRGPRLGEAGEALARAVVESLRDETLVAAA